MARTTYNIDAFNNHQSGMLKESIMLTKKEQQEILRHLSELKDMHDNDELKQDSKGNIILNHLNSVGSIISNK